LEHGTGALNIAATRITASEALTRPAIRRDDNAVLGKGLGVGAQTEPAGRWPTNVVLDHTAAEQLDRETGVSTSAAGPTTYSQRRGGEAMTAARGAAPNLGRREVVVEGYGDTGGASRFFPTFRYEPKAPTHERPRDGDAAHPTVKPLDLMRWLVRLVTPPGGVVLDCFAGSGTTGEACVIEGFKAVLIEREPAYLPLIVARLSKPIQPDLFGAVLEDAPIPEWPTPESPPPPRVKPKPSPVVDELDLFDGLGA
jgi:site-specific DNA-methyltransferase (adenine-specific)